MSDYERSNRSSQDEYERSEEPSVWERCDSMKREEREYQDICDSCDASWWRH